MNNFKTIASQYARLYMKTTIKPKQENFKLLNMNDAKWAPLIKFDLQFYDFASDINL